MQAMDQEARIGNELFSLGAGESAASTALPVTTRLSPTRGDKVTATQGTQGTQATQATQATQMVVVVPQLPLDVVLLIMAQLDAKTLLHATETCQMWWSLAKHYHQFLWRDLARRDFSFTAARGLWKLEFDKTQSSNPLLARRPPTSPPSLAPPAAAVLSTSTPWQRRNIPQAPSALQTMTASNRHPHRQQEKDWKSLYTLTSNWYRGRARGYCPILLPSTPIRSTIISPQPPGSLSLSEASESKNTNATAESSRPNPRRRSILDNMQDLLQNRQPGAVVGYQYEGSASTQMNLTRIPQSLPIQSDDESDHEFDSKRHKSRGTRNKKEPKMGKVSLVRSNPHYRLQHGHDAHLQSGDPTSSSHQLPNIVLQNPWHHDQYQFAISMASTPPALPFIEPDTAGAIQQQQQQQQLYPNNNSNNSNNGDNNSNTNSHTSLNTDSPTTSPILNPNDASLANDVVCQFASPLHPYLVTGHLDGMVRLWDLSCSTPGQQCLRRWHAGSRRRVLCVGMNSKVVVCGNDDSTLRVWDIHPASDSCPKLSSPSPSFGTIHCASFRTNPGSELDQWASGVEQICVGDSLVACLTEFSASVLIFSLATGSRVYEIPELYPPMKMCMTNFFLVAGGRSPLYPDLAATRAAAQQELLQRAANRDGSGSRTESGHHQNAMSGSVSSSPTRTRTLPRAGDIHEVTAVRSRYGPWDDTTCCINIWDLRTGECLYSLLPKLPPLCPQPMTEAENNSHSSGQGLDSLNNLKGGSTFAGTGPRVTGQVPVVAAPLTLVDISVTADQSTLLVALRERSRDGREGVYAWDFTGTRLEGYHEEGPPRKENIIMQQIGTHSLQEMHQARVTGKAWIGWTPLNEQKQIVNDELSGRSSLPGMNNTSLTLPSSPPFTFTSRELRPVSSPSPSPPPFMSASTSLTTTGITTTTTSLPCSPFEKELLGTTISSGHHEEELEIDCTFDEAFSNLSLREMFDRVVL